MVWIPGGSFEMGDHFNEGNTNELPIHTVELDGFYMDMNEVTVSQFKQFVEQNDYQYDGDWSRVAIYSPGDEYPAVLVSWNDAVSYATWVGKRLPTEAEWEYAARGGLAGKRYPWGDEITHDNATYGSSGFTDDIGCTPVGSFEANGYGLFDMAGNVMEWCADWYGTDYYSNSPAKNPPGPGTGSERVVRGGCWLGASITLRVAARIRNNPTNRSSIKGFRCVSDLP